MRLRPACFFVLSLLAICGWTPSVVAQQSACSNPRQSVVALFEGQQDGVPPNWPLATRCLDARGRKPSTLQRSARRIKAVYNSKGAWIEVDDISKDPNFSVGGKLAKVVPHPTFPEIAVRKIQGRWVWTKRSLDWVDGYYERKLGWVERWVEKLPPSLKVQFFSLAVWQILALIFLLCLGLVARRLLRAVVAERLRRLGDKLDRPWSKKIVDVVDAPGATLVTAVVLRLGYPQLHLPVGLAKALSQGVEVLITFSVVWALYRAVDVLSAKMQDKANETESRLDDQLVPLVRKALKLVVFMVGTLLILQNLDVNVWALMTSFSIGTLAVGLAAKDTLANLFGSISIFVDTPFQIGDWINVAGIDGTVEEVGFRSTRIRTFYDSVVVLPNATIANAKVDNYGQRKHRRTSTKLGITYDSSPEQIQAFCEGLRAIIKANPRTVKDRFEVHFSGFGDSALEILLYYFYECETWTEELTERHNMYLEIIRLADSLGVGFAFPTQSLHLESVALPKDRNLPEAMDRKQLRNLVEGYGPGGKQSQPTTPRISERGFMPDPAAPADVPEDSSGA